MVDTGDKTTWIEKQASFQYINNNADNVHTRKAK